MRILVIFGVVCAALTSAAAAEASPSVEIRGAAARIVVIPENRTSIDVVIVHAARALPLKIRRAGQRVTITGTVARRVHGCGVAAGRPTVRIGNRKDIALDALPRIVVRAPMDVRLTAGDAVFGDIGRSATLDLTNQGCGVWTVADVARRMRIDQAGAGLTRTGTAQTANISVAGSGTVTTRAIQGAVTAVSSGAGDIMIAAISGVLDARVAGAGAIRVAAGQAPSVKASIAGSGEIAFAGDAKDLDVMIAGPGRVKVGRVTGTVTKRVFGSGTATIGP